MMHRGSSPHAGTVVITIPPALGHPLARMIQLSYESVLYSGP